MPPVPETIIHPIGISIDKSNTPHGVIAHIKFMTPFHTFIVRIPGEENIREFATSLTGGIQPATLADLVDLKK